MFKKIILAALLAAPLSAFASGIYLTAGVGVGTTDVDDINDEVFVSNGIPSKVDDDLQRAVIGVGVDVNENLAFEATYMTEAEAEITDDVGAGSKLSLKHSNIQLAVIGKAPLGAQFALLGKLSANVVATDAAFDVPGVYHYDESDSAVQLGFGIGASYQVSDRAGIQLMLERIQIKDFVDESQLSNNDADVNQVTLAVKFGF